MLKILVCDLELNYLVQHELNSFDITTITSEEEFSNATFHVAYDLYIANVYYFDLVKELRTAGDSAVCIFIDEYYCLNNLKKAFNIGDDYLIKPVNIQELKIRVQYHYKKLFNIDKDIIHYKNMFFHIQTQQLFQNNKKIKLSPSETKLVGLFLSHINKPLQKNIIFEKLETTSDGTLRVYISKLNKIGFLINYERANQSYSLHKPHTNF